MRTLNSKSGTLTPMQQTNVDIEDRQPCWYANMEKSANRKDYKWKVGCKHDGNTDEFEFKVSKVGNVNDEKFWGRITSSEFAVKLINLFRIGGQKFVKEWIRKGCP